MTHSIAPLVSALCTLSAATAAHPAAREEGPLAPARSIAVSASDSLVVACVEGWIKGFQEAHPDTDITIRPSTGPLPYSMMGRDVLHATSFSLDNKWQQILRKHLGYEPPEIQVGWGAIAVFVNKANPLDSITLPQLKAVFASAHDGEVTTAIDAWDGLGQNGAWSGTLIEVLGLSSASSVENRFKAIALNQRDFKASIRVMPGQRSLLQACATELRAIGYGTILSQRDDPRLVSVKMLPLARTAAHRPEIPSAEHVRDGRYPLAYPLSFVVKQDPGRAIDPLVREFLEFTLSKAGQEILESVDCVSLSPSQVNTSRDMLCKWE